MWVIRAGIHKKLVRIANREDPDQTAFQKQSDLGLHCLSRFFWQVTSVQNFRTFTVGRIHYYRAFSCNFGKRPLTRMGNK